MQCVSCGFNCDEGYCKKCGKLNIQEKYGTLRFFITLSNIIFAIGIVAGLIIYLSSFSIYGVGLSLGCFYGISLISIGNIFIDMEENSRKMIFEIRRLQYVPPASQPTNNKNEETN